MRLFRLVRRVSIIAALAVLALTGVGYAVPVGRIEIEGAKSKPEVVAALLDTQAGAQFDAGVWERDRKSVV